MSEKDEQVVSQTPKKKTHTGKKKRGRFGMAVRQGDQDHCDRGDSLRRGLVWIEGVYQ